MDLLDVGIFLKVINKQMSLLLDNDKTRYSILNMLMANRIVRCNPLNETQ